MKLLLKNNSTIRVIADSAIGRNNQPWFIPDFGEDWSWTTAVAYRINKLGKNVSPAFAGRYIDATTLFWVPQARDCSAVDFMDAAVVCGNWLPLTDIPDEAISFLTEVTHFATVKTGDILAIMTGGKPQPLSCNQHISLSINENEVLNFNIK